MLTVASLQDGKNGLQVSTAALFKVETPNFDVSPDGQRILIYRPAEEFRRPSITLITNWPALLSKR